MSGERSEMMFDERLRTVLALDPAVGAIDFEGSWRSWGWIATLGEKLDTLLTEAGIATDMPVGLIARNRPATVAAMFMMLANRRPVIMINPLQPAALLQQDIRNLRLDAIVADRSDWESEGVISAATETGSIGIAVYDDVVALQPGLTILGSGPHRSDDLVGVAIEMLSSGTTGTPKRIKLMRDKLDASLADGLRSSKDAGALSLKTSPYLLYVPIVHLSGMYAAVLSFFEGRPIVLLEKFTIEGWLNAVRVYRPRFAGLVPPMVRMILDAKVAKEDLSSLIAVRCGTAALDPDLQAKFEETYDVPILINYGATEFVGAVAGWTLDEHKQFAVAKRGSVGRARGHFGLHAVDQVTGEPLPAGGIEILEIGAGKSGEFARTTDLASLDADGFLFIHGRSEGMIIRGGFKVPGDVVAATLLRHPAVIEAVVVGIDDERLGQVPVAAVEIKPNVAPPTEADLIAFARAALIPYQVPARILIMSDLPRTPSMKISRPRALDRIQAALTAA